MDRDELCKHWKWEIAAAIPGINIKTSSSRWSYLAKYSLTTLLVQLKLLGSNDLPNTIFQGPY